MRKDYQRTIIPVKSDGSKTNEMSGQGMQHFPKKIKPSTPPKKNSHSKVLGVYCTVGNTGCVPEGKEEQADLERTKGKSDCAAHWRKELEGGRLRYP